AFGNHAHGQLIPAVAPVAEDAHVLDGDAAVDAGTAPRARRLEKRCLAAHRRPSAAKEDDFVVHQLENAIEIRRLLPLHPGGGEGSNRLLVAVRVRAHRRTSSLSSARRSSVPTLT